MKCVTAILVAAFFPSMSASEFDCGDGWRNVGSGTKTVCVRHFSEQVSWYEAEGVCAGYGGHLAAVTSAEVAEAVSLSSGAASWVGGYDSGTSWMWSTGAVLDKVHLNELTDATRTYPAQMCLTEQSVSLCTTFHSFVCQVDLCRNVFDDSTTHFSAKAMELQVSSNGVVLVDGVPSAVGVWETHSRYVSTSYPLLAQFGCTLSGQWVASFSYEDDVPLVHVGCAGALQPAHFLQRPKCVLPRNSNNDNGTDWLRPPTKVPTSAANSTISPSMSGGEDIPMWVWPLAFVSVAAVSVLMGVGALSRKQRRSQAQAAREAKSSEVDDFESGGSSGQLETEMDSTRNEQKDVHNCPRQERTTETCDTCQRFDTSIATQRLHAVHEHLVRDFSVPLAIHSTRCEHIGGDHVHIFTVDNTFSASSLGTLSTVYSRAKPRLPRSTRIHIVRKEDATPDPAPEEAFGSDMYYDGPTYY